MSPSSSQVISILPVMKPPQEHGFVYPFADLSVAMQASSQAYLEWVNSPLTPSIWGCGDFSPNSHGQASCELTDSPSVQLNLDSSLERRLRYNASTEEKMKSQNPLSSLCITTKHGQICLHSSCGSFNSFQRVCLKTEVWTRTGSKVNPNPQTPTTPPVPLLCSSLLGKPSQE